MVKSPPDEKILKLRIWMKNAFLVSKEMVELDFESLAKTASNQIKEDISHDLFKSVMVSEPFKIELRKNKYFGNAYFFR